MKSTKTFFFLAVLLIAGSISAYAGGTFDDIADTAKRANEAVRGVNDVICGINPGGNVYR
jgi:predicted TIM-barrel enzyme